MRLTPSTGLTSPANLLFSCSRVSGAAGLPDMSSIWQTWTLPFSASVDLKFSHFKFTEVFYVLQHKGKRSADS